MSARWAIDWPGSLIQAVPRGDHITLVGDDASTSSGLHLAAVDRDTGKVGETLTLSDCAAMPIDGSTRLFATCGDRYSRTALAAIDPDTLSVLWKRDLGGRIYSVSASGDLVLASVKPTDTSGRLVAIAADGSERWRADFATESRLALFVIEASDRVIVFEADPHVWAFDRATGKLLWAHSMTDMINDVDVVDGDVQIEQNQGKTTLDSSGNQVAFTAAPPPDEADAAARQNAALVDTEQGIDYTCAHGILTARAHDGGKRLWWADTGPDCRVTLAPVDDGELAWVLATVEGQLFAFDPAHPSTSEETMTIRGRYDEKIAGVRVWVGNRAVRTDRRGRFKAKISRRSIVTIELDARDLGGEISQPVVVMDGDKDAVELTSYFVESDDE